MVVKTLVSVFLLTLFMTDGVAEQPRKCNKNASTSFLNLTIPKSFQLWLDLQYSHLISFFKAMKATYTIVLLEVLFSLPLFVFGFFFLSPIVLGQKSSSALSFVDGRQDRWTRNINICVGMSQWRLTPEASESKNRERKDEGLSHSLASAAQVSVLLTAG